MLPPPEERFTATADLYARHRPGYPRELVDWIVATAGLRPGERVIDLGCGTGIATRLFAERGFATTGIDPNDAMLEHARSAGGGACYVRGTATVTGLPDACAELAVAGQAFHWFDLDPTFAELGRVLVPGGWCAAFWNVRARGPLMDAYEELLKGLSADYGSVPKPLPTIAAIEARADVRDVRRTELENRQLLDQDELRGRAFSSSYVQHGVERRADFERALDALFDAHRSGESVAFIYRTIAIAWRLAR